MHLFYTCFVCFVSGGVNLSIREANSRQTSQARAAGKSGGNIAERRQTSYEAKTSKNTQSSTSSGRVTVSIIFSSDTI